MPLVIQIKVIPSSAYNKPKLDRSNILKWYLKAAPENNKANHELLKTIAKLLQTTQDKITILAGQTSRTKLVKIDLPITYEQFLAAIGIEQQLTAF